MGLGFAVPAPAPHPTVATGIEKINHVVIIMQENRSFDSYFGTYPGADGIPMQGGVPTVCVPDPQAGHCIRPFHNPKDRNEGGPHGAPQASIDIDGGAMDGFIRAFYRGRAQSCQLFPNSPICTVPTGRPDVMGWHDAREIPNYWTYAQQFVLQDHMFEPVRSYSEPSHLYMVSGWSAFCTDPYDASTCSNALVNLDREFGDNTPDYGWTDITYLLNQNHVSWGYYVAPGTVPDCDDGSMACVPDSQNPGTPEAWSPLRDFITVHQDQQLNNVQTASNFFQSAKDGTLPSVSWVVPDDNNSEHPPHPISAGQAWVTSAVNAVMSGPDWNSSAIFISWDDWGGFYDHVNPPNIDAMGYGLRVPGLMISPYARQGYIDHQQMSFDSYLRFIEDRWLSGQRLNPASDGRPDPRPMPGGLTREEISGDITSEFDFTQSPRPPVLLPLHPPPGPPSIPGT
jgi:phospholipase C